MGGSPLNICNNFIQKREIAVIFLHDILYGAEKLGRAWVHYASKPGNNTKQIFTFKIFLSVPDQLAIGTMSDCNFDPALAVVIITHLSLPTILNLCTYQLDLYMQLLVKQAPDLLIHSQ